MTQEPQRIPTYRKMLGFVPHPNLRGLSKAHPMLVGANTGWFRLGRIFG